LIFEQKKKDLFREAMLKNVSLGFFGIYKDYIILIMYDRRAHFTSLVSSSQVDDSEKKNNSVA